MLHKRKRSYYGRSGSNLMPTLVVLLVSLLAALGGAIYWDKVQDGEQANAVTYTNETTITEEEISLPYPEDNSPSKTAETSEEEPASETEEETPDEKEEVPQSSTNGTVVPLCDEVDASYFSDAAFIGDSLTQGLQLYDILDTNVIANKGINLSTVYDAEKIRVAEGYTSVFAELERLQPAKIYVLLGMNDIAWRTEGDFIRLYGELIDNLQTEFPDAVLYIQSIFPVTGWYAAEDNGIDNSKVVTYNEELMALAEEKDCYYLDVRSVLIDDNGTLPDEASPDGIHLNAPYYKHWFDYLKTHVVP